ncbi:MAG: LPS export ABC transporter ATP-binding protein [bacterium]
MSTELVGENLTKEYGGRKVVRGVDLEVYGGEVVGLLGPNGAGKTTTFRMLVGLINPLEGRVFLNGQDITSLPLYRRAGKGLGYLPQEPSVFRNLTVEENFQAIFELVENSRVNIDRRIQELIEDFSLEHVASTLGHSLSGGERRRVEIARALIPDPDFLLLDEPFAGIDPLAVEEIQRLVKDLKEREIGILITDHNVQETLQITDRSYIMNEGNILISGDARTLVEDSQAREIYLGSSFSYQYPAGTEDDE